MDLMTLVAKLRMDSSDYESKLGTLPNMAAGAGKLVSTALKTWIGVKAVGALKDFAKSSIETGRTFDASMSQLAATMGTTASKIGELRDYAKEMGRTTVFTASQAADAMNILAMAGYAQEDIIKTLPATLSLAAAGNLDIAQAADYATGIMAGFNMEMDEAGKVGNALAKIASSAKGDVASFGEGLSSVAGTASVTGQNMTDMTVALGILGNHNISAAEAGNALNRSLRNLYMASGDSAETLHALGVEMYDMATGQARALPDVLRDLNASLDGMTDAQKNNILSKIFDAATLKSVPFLIDGVTTEWDKLDEAVKSSWFTKDSLTAQLDSVGLSLGGMRHNMRALGVDGDTFNKMLAESGGNADAFADMLLDASKEGTKFEDVVEALGGDLDVLGATFSNTTGAAQAMADEQVNNLDGAMKLFSSAVESAQIAVSDKLAPSLTSLVHFATNAISGVTDAFEKGGLQGAFEAFGTYADIGLQKIREKTPDFIKGGVDIIAKLVQGVMDSAPSMMSEMGNVISILASAITDNLPALLDSGSQMVTSLFDGLMTGIPQFVQFGGEMLANIGSGLVEGIPQFLENALPMILSFSGMLRENAGSLVDSGIQMILNIGQGIVNSLPDLIAYVPQIITNIAGIINDNAPKLLLAAGQLILMLGKGLIDNIPNIIANMGNIIEAIISVITAINWLQLGGNIIKFIGDGIKNMGEFGKSLMNDFLTKLKDPFTSMGDTFKSLGSNIVKGIASGIRSMFDFGVNAIKGLGESMLNGFKGLFGIHSPSAVMEDQATFLVEGLLNGLTDMPSEFVEKISQVLVDVYMWGYDLQQKGIDAAVNFVTGLVDNIVSLPSKIIETVGQVLVDIYTWGHDLTQKGIDAAVNFVTGLVDNIISLPSKIIETVGQVLVDIYMWGYNLQQQGIEAAINFVSGLINNIAELPSKFIEFFTQILTDFASWGVNIATKAAEYITQLRENILKTVSDIPKKMFDVGKNIIQGLWDGLKSLGSSVVSWVGGLFNDMISIGKKTTQEHSPSRVFAKIGGYMAEGVKVGWENKYDRIRKSIEDGMTFSTDEYGLTGLTTANTGEKKSDEYAEIKSLLHQLVLKETNVTLEGDAGKIFKVVKDSDKKFKERTGSSTFVYG